MHPYFVFCLYVYIYIYIYILISVTVIREVILNTISNWVEWNKSRELKRQNN